jgi:conjugal transfer/entry exclusion protein
MSDDTQHEIILGQLQEVHQKVTSLHDECERIHSVVDEIKSAQKQEQEDGYWTKKDVAEIKQTLGDLKALLDRTKDIDERLENDSRETKRAFDQQVDNSKAAERDMGAIKDKLDALTRMVENLKS